MWGSIPRFEAGTSWEADILPRCLLNLIAESLTKNFFKRVVLELLVYLTTEASQKKKLKDTHKEFLLGYLGNNIFCSSASQTK